MKPTKSKKSAGDQSAPTEEENYLLVVRRLKEAVENSVVEYSNAFVLKGKELKPFATDQETADRIAREKASMEKKFKSGKELAEIVLNNNKALFGEKTVMVDLQRQTIIHFGNGFLPDGILFDMGEKPGIYFTQAMISSENFAYLLTQLTRLFTFFRKKESISLFREIMGKAINRNIGLRNRLNKCLGEKSIPEFLEEAVKVKPGVLLITDDRREELANVMETYPDTWGKIKHAVIKKFALNGDTLITIILPNAKANGRKSGSAEKVVKATEEDHLESTSAEMKEIFLHLKDELLKEYSALEFRVKQYYISLRKDRNLAFFQLGKKKLTIVIANPEKNTVKQIKHHEIRTLADSVKKFWNGNEHCFTVVIENKEHLSEITQLLKKLLVNGEKKSDVTAPETADLSAEALAQAETASDEAKKARTGKNSPASLPVRSETKAGASAKAGSPQAKPRRKGRPASRSPKGAGRK